MMTHLLRKQITTALLALCATAIAASGKTITVTNNNDSGAGSLRAAVTEANGNGEPDTIVFDGGFFSTPRTITLTSGELQVTRDGSPGSEPGRLLTIRGPGANLLTISGNNSSRVFYVSNFGNVAMSGVTVAGGNGIGTVLNEEGNSGGGLLAHSSFVSLSDVTFRNNAAPNAGGAIYFSSMRNIALANTLITENTAAFGGGIYDVGDTPATTQRVYTDVTISNNTARNREGGAFMSAGTTTMTNCRITGNKARSAQPAAGAAGNGGMLLSGGVATITDTVISDNVAGAVPSAEFPNGVYGVNGGLNINATLCVLKRVTVSGNIDHQTGVAAGAGMKLHAVGDITITVSDSLVSNNRHIAFTTPGGGPLPITSGAGILTDATAGTISIINTTITGNVAENGFGGGIFNLTNGLRIINCTITGNVGPYNDPNIAEKGGGGIHTRSGSATVSIQNSIIAGNTSPPGPDVRGQVISTGYNIIGNTAGSTGFGAAGDQLNVNPLLDSSGLRNNGGATLTIALQPNSPAIDKGKTVAEATTDQRGVTRPTDNPSIANAAGGDGSDIGAYEVGGNNGVAEKTLGNIATRLQVERGENVLIGGIIIVGDVPKRIIIRALGPSLGAAGVNGALENPTLALFDGETLLAANNNWRDQQQGEIAETGVAPSDDREAAIVRTLNPGSYTAIVRGNNDTTGVGLIEAYDLDQRPNSKLGNISTRGFVASGENVLIGGFIVGPTTQVVVRAVGPSLGNAGIAGSLQDPTLDLVNENGEVLRTNDNWKGTQRAELEAIGIQPTDDRESALIATLTAGNYTAVVRGVGSSTGVGLVEVYNLP